jgi:D-alanine-D-alanine ligase-like ATP-grasp enzyme
MQLLFLSGTGCAGSLNRGVLELPWIRQRNLIHAQIEDLDERDGFVYADKCILLAQSKCANNVLLSPSLVVNLSGSAEQVFIDDWLRRCWGNTWQICCRPASGLFDNEFNFHQSLLHGQSSCFVTVEVPDKPVIRVLEDTINLIDKTGMVVNPHSVRGLIEYAVTDYFAAGYFKFLKPETAIRGRQNSIFFIQMSLDRAAGDFEVTVLSAAPVLFDQFINHSLSHLATYVDRINAIRVKEFASKLYFREQILRECERAGVVLEPTCKNMFFLQHDREYGLHKAYFGGVNDENGLRRANSKHETNQFLGNLGFQVNFSQELVLNDLLAQVETQAIELKYPLVLKPSDLQGGAGVFTDIRSQVALLTAIDLLKNMKNVNKVLLENFFSGATYRFLVVGFETLAVLKFEYPCITGDGNHTIDELIKRKNWIAKSTIKMTEIIKLNLATRNFKKESVLSRGLKLVLSHDSHPSLGAGAVEVTGLIDQAYKIIAADVAAAMALQVCGIDIMINPQGDYRVIEVNTAPALSTHQDPQYGNSVDVYRHVMNVILKKTTIEAGNSFFPELAYYHG